MLLCNFPIAGIRSLRSKFSIWMANVQDFTAIRILGQTKS